MMRSNNKNNKNHQHMNGDEITLHDHDESRMMSNKKYIHGATEVLYKQKELADELSKSNLAGKPVAVIAGPTRSGKSTLLARIQESCTPEEFVRLLKDIENSQKMYEKIGKIKIGTSSNGSTTLVPNMFPSKNLIDIAGFIDTNKQNAALISLINLNLFSKLGKCCFVITFDLHNILDMSVFNSTMNTYVNEFKTMFSSENFDQLLEVTSFVMTKTDKIGDKLRATCKPLLPFQVTWPKVEDMKADEILDEQTKCITTILKNYESRQDNDEIVKVIKQMYRKMVVADYRYLTSNDIEDQLSKLVRNSPRLSGDRLKFDSVSQTNELCTKTIQVINDHLHDIKVYQENYQEKSNETHEAIHEFKEKNNNLNNEKLNLEIDLEDAQKKLMAQEVEMKEIVRFQSEFEKNLQSLEDDQKKSQEQYDRLKGGLGSLRFLNVQEIKSIPWKKWMQQVYRVQSEVTGANGSVGSPTIVVLDLKTFGEYRERIFQCSNKEEFDALDIQGVAIRIEEDKDTFDIKMAVNAKNTTLNITSKIEIVVLVVSEINIADSPNIKVFLNQVYDMIEGIKQKINDLKHKREVLKRRVPQLGAEIKDTDKAIKNLKESILSKKTQQVSLKKIHDQQIINSKTNMLEIQQNVKNLTEKELYTVCGDMCQLLINSRIESERFSKFNMIQLRIDNLVNEISDKINEL